MNQPSAVAERLPEEAELRLGEVVRAPAGGVTARASFKVLAARAMGVPAVRSGAGLDEVQLPVAGHTPQLRTSALAKPQS